MNKLCLNVFCGFEFDEMCSLAKKVGFDGVFSDECDAVKPQKIKQNRAMVDKYSLYYETSHAKIPGCTDIWKGADKAREYEAVLKVCIDNCTANHIPILVVHIQTDKQEMQLECGMEALERIVKYAEKNNVKIAFENINNASLLYYVLDSFKTPNVGFCFDSGHKLCHTPGEDYLSRIGERLICTHLHDNDGNGDFHQLLYTGKVDFKRITSQLKELEYNGALSLELAYLGNMSKNEFLSRGMEGLKRLRSEIY